MNRNYTQRHLRINPASGDNHRLEAFIEQICDDYQIYDAYFGNIMASNNLAFEICSELKPATDLTLDIYFRSQPEGMYFTIKLYHCFLDIVALYEKVKDKNADDPEAFAGDWHQMMMIRLLSDDIRIDHNEEAIELIFHITGINEVLTNQRIELLNQYYSLINTLVNQQ